ncbi:uncharacterized protein N7503_005324 [Penicillium pulvis]|uniref:uncharacterized protein n=1 Tax=Penicillium pulvis TaxID=1562058 RepID=UPI0025474AF2|nr:uncharacterized protein N7503_005324 [Penicillium pulvis]KAJ5802874.1 hypothetical protein N7503_005324 [Penicillium pulvis]
MSPRFFTFLGIISLAGLIVGIVGAVLAVEDSVGISYSNNSQDAGCIQTFHAYHSQERRKVLGHEIYVIAAVGAALPFLLIRVIYASIADYGINLDFNFYDGNVTIYLCMGVLVEIIVTTICLAVGFLVPLMPVDEAIPKRNRSRQHNREVVVGSEA